MDKNSELVKIEKFLDINKSELSHLLSLDDLTFLRLLSPLILLSYVDSLLEKTNDSILRTTMYISMIEAVQNVKSKGKLHKKELVFSFLQENCSQNQKIELLRGYTFSKNYKFKEGDLVSDHLMRSECEKDRPFINDAYKDYCQTGAFVECSCIAWLRRKPEKIDYFLEKLSDHFYKMRCAVLHDGTGVLWVHDFENNPPTSSGTLFDAYSIVNNTKFVSYASGMNKKDLYPILRLSLKNFLLKF